MAGSKITPDAWRDHDPKRKPVWGGGGAGFVDFRRKTPIHQRVGESAGSVRSWTVPLGLVVGRAEAQRPKELADVTRQELRLLKRREMSALGHHRMPPQVVGPLDPFLGRRRRNVGREGRKGGR